MLKQEGTGRTQAVPLAFYHSKVIAGSELKEFLKSPSNTLDGINYDSLRLIRAPGLYLTDSIPLRKTLIADHYLRIDF